MVRETRYLIVRNLPENCTEETIIDHFQRYGKIQSVKLQAAKDNDTDNTATVAFNDIKSAAKAHHATNIIGKVTLRTDYWEGSTGTPALANTPVAGSSSVRSSTYSSANTPASRLVSTFPTWSKGTSDEDGPNIHDKVDISQTSTAGINTFVTASAALDKLSSTAFDLQRGRGRERIKQKKFGQKFEKSGSFGRHGTTTSTRSLEAARSQSEAAAAAAAVALSLSATPATTSGSSSSSGNTSGLNPIIVSDSKDMSSRDLKESNRESSSMSRPHSVASPSSRNSGVNRLNSQSRSVSHSRSRSRGSRSSSCRSRSSGTSQSTSPHRSHASSTTRPQSMVGTSRLVNSEVKEAKRDENGGERRPLGICVMRLPMRSTDSSLRDGLYHEYKKHGKVTTVQICGDGEGRCAVVSFRKPEDASKALEASQGKKFFGAKIKVASHEGVEVDDTDRGNDIDSLDEYHVKSTRTLFVGNLEKETTTQDLIEKFKQFGDIIDVDIKRQGASTAFAFVQYADISSVVMALRAMEGEHIGINKIKLGFGKSMPTCCVWMDCLPTDANNRMLRTAMTRYGEVTYCCMDRNRNKGLVYFTSYEDAQRCVNDIKMRPFVMKKKLQIDFASRECQTDFLDRMETSGQLRANERPDESRVHKFRQQRSFDSFQEDGSPSAYGFNRTSTSFTTRNGRSNSGSTSYRRGRQYAEATFPEENHTGSRRSRRQEEFNQAGQFYSGKGSNDDYDAVLREYGHSQRERRERDLSPRPSVDRRVDGQSRQSSRDHSLDRYDKDRTVEIFNSRDTSPGSDHNSYHSDSRYRSSRDEKFSSREHYEDTKAEDNDHHIRVSCNTSPHIHNHSSSLSHDSDYEHRGGSRSQSPPTPIQEDSSIHRIYYSDDCKRSVEIGDDYSTYSGSQKQKDSEELGGKAKLVSIHSSKLGAEVIKTAGKSRKRTHEESGLSDLSKMDTKLLRKSDKPVLLLEKGKVHSEKEKNYEASRQMLKVPERTGSPGSSASHGDSENGSVSEGDLHHLHQEKHHILRKLRELNEEVVGTSEPDSPRSVAKVKSVAVKEALRLSGRSHEDRKGDEGLGKADAHRRTGAKVRGLDSRRESRNHLSDDLNLTRADKNLVDKKDGSFGGHSDSDCGSDFRRNKKRRTDPSVDIVSVKDKGYRRAGSVDVSEDDDLDRKSDHSFRIHSSSVVKRVSCDSRVGSKSYSEPNKTMGVSSSDSGDLFKDGLSDQDLSVIKQPRSVSKNIFFPNRAWNERSPVGCFSPAYSEEHTQDSVTSGSLTEKSSKHLSSSPWQHSPPASPTGKDNSDADYGYYKDFTLPGSSSPEDCLSDDSMEGELLQPPPGEPSVEERIRAIDEMLNMTTSNKSSDPSLLISVLSNKDITNNNDNTALYSKFRIRKREGVLDGGNGSLLTERRPEPSVIMQQVLSKKSILDQDFKRLEQMSEIYDLGSAKELSTLLKSEVSSPKLVDLKGDLYLKPLLSPSLLLSSSSLLMSSHPVTTSSSMLQPTITTSVAGSASSFAVLSASVLTTSIVSAPVTTCSIHTSTKPAAVDNSKRSKIKSLEIFEEVSERHTVCTNSLTLKQDVIVVSSSLSSSSNPVFSNNSLSSTSLPLVSSLSPSLTSSIVGPVLTENTTSVSQQSCKFFASPSPSLLSPSVSTFSISVPPPMHPKTNLQQSVLISPYTSFLSSSLSATQLTSGAHVAAPFTQGPDKSQLTPTVGQEAPRLCSPSFTPENSRTSMSSHMSGCRSPRVSTHTADKDDPQKISSETDLKVSVFNEADSKTDELKANSVTPDIESPISVQSETSSIASVPLSSIDIKANLHVEEKILAIPSIVSPHSTNSLHNSGLNLFLKNSDCVKTESLSPELVSEKTVAEIVGKGKEISNKKCNELHEAAEILVSRKTELSPVVLTQTVMSVISKDNPDKELSYVADISNSSKGQPGTCSSIHLNSDTDTAPALKVVVPSSSAAIPSTSMSTISTSRLPSDKSEKKATGKMNSSYSKMSSGSAKSEALFAPDVKMEQMVKPGDAKSDLRHQSVKGTPNKSNSSDKKSGKLTSKDAHEHKDLSNSKDPDKRSESDHKNSVAQDSCKKETNKIKDKRDQSKDNEKNKLKDETKKKGERKVSEKKVERKNVAAKEEKKVDKKDEKKDRNSEKLKDSVKPVQTKHSKLEGTGNKQDKKQKEKAKVANNKDKEKSGDKKMLTSLSCVTKPGAPLEPKQESKNTLKSDTKDSKSAKNDSSAKDSAGKDLTTKDSAGKDSTKDSAGKDSTKDSAGKDSTAKDATAKSEKECVQKTETVVKSEQKTAKHKSDPKGANRLASDARCDSKEGQSTAASTKKSCEASKPKKELENEGTKQSLGKQSDKLLKLKQREEEKLKEKRKLKEDKDRQKEREEKEREEREKQKEKEKEEKEKQKEKEKEEREKQKEKEKEEREKQKEKEKEEREKQKKEREEKERKEQEERERKEKEEKERLKEEKERQKEMEREEKERKEKEKEERERQKEKEREEKERQKEKEREEKERKEKEKEEKERQKEREREEKEKQKEREREEKEKKEREKEEREKQKQKEREEKERQKEKEREEREKKEKEEKERIKKEKVEREKQKQKERDEKESQKEKEKLEKKSKEKEEKQKEKEKKEKEKKDRKPEKKEKGKVVKDGKMKKEKEERGKKDRDEKTKPDKEEKEKSNKEKEKAEKEDKKKPAPKKPKRNELAALLEHNDMIQMSFTSMYDRVKTQRNREPELQHKTEPAPKSSFDKFKQNRKKNGSKIRSPLYSFDTSSGASDNDLLSDLSEPESTQKAEPVKETKTKKTKQIKRPHVSSSSSSSCEDDDDALLRASKLKDKKTDKFSEIFSSDSEDDNFQPPSSKLKTSAKSKVKPAAKRRKNRDGSSDSMASRDDFVKPQAFSSVTDSLDDMDVSEEEEVKSKRKKTKVKTPKSIEREERNSSIESVTKKTLKLDPDSSLESVPKKPLKVDKEDNLAKKSKLDSKKATKTHESKSLKEENKSMISEKKKGKNESEKVVDKMEIINKNETKKSKSKVESDKSAVKPKSKVDAEKPKSKTEPLSKTDQEKSKPKVGSENKTKGESVMLDTDKHKAKEDDKHKVNDDKLKPKEDEKHKVIDDKLKPKEDEKHKVVDDKLKPKEDEKHKVVDDKLKPKEDEKHKVVDDKLKPKEDEKHKVVDDKLKPKEDEKHKVVDDKLKPKEDEKHKVVDDKLKPKEDEKHKVVDDKLKSKEDEKHKVVNDKSKEDEKAKTKNEEKPKLKDEEKAKSRDEDKQQKSKIEPEIKPDQEKPKAKTELENKSDVEKAKSKPESDSKSETEKHLSKGETGSKIDSDKPKVRTELGSNDSDKPKVRTELGSNDSDKPKVRTESGSKSEKAKSSTETENKPEMEKSRSKIEPENKHEEEKAKLKDKISSDGKSKSLAERKKKNDDKDESCVKKKKKKKYDPLIEEELVNSLITKVYDKVERDKKDKKKTKMNLFDSEPEDTLQSDTSSGILSSHDEKPAKDVEELEPIRSKGDKLDSSKVAIKSDKHIDTKPSDEEASQVSKKKHKKKKDKKEEQKEPVVKTKESIKKKQVEMKEKKKSEIDLKAEKMSKHEDQSEDEHLKPPKKKRKKKEHERDVDMEKEKPTKCGKSPQKKAEAEKSHTSGDEKECSNLSEDKSSSQIVDEFTSFWGHPKPILIPKRLKDTKKSDDEKSKHKDECKTEVNSDKSEASEKVKEEPSFGKDEKQHHGDDKLLDVATAKMELEVSDDFVVPISEAETTVITEVASSVCESISSIGGDSLVIHEETVSAEEITIMPDETTVGSSVEIDDDDFPSLVIDEIPEKSEKKTVKKDKKLLKKQQEKERNDHMVEVIASVAMALSSDDEDDQTSLLIEPAKADQELLLSDVINQELKYGNKSEHERTSNIFSDILFPEKEKKEKQPNITSPLGGVQKDRETKSGPTKKESEKKKDVLKIFGPLDEETKKRDEELLKTLAVLCDPNVDKPVVIEDIKHEPTEEEIKQKEEAEKRKAEEERKKAEEEEKTRREKEEEAMKEASDEAARAVESLLEFQSGYDQESVDMDDDLPPLFIEPADKEPPAEVTPMSPSENKSDIVSIFSSQIPDKVTTNLDDKLLEKKSDKKGPTDQTDSKLDHFNLFATPAQSIAPVSVFTSPRNSVPAIREKTPEPITLTSPQRQIPPSPQMHSPHRLQFPTRTLHSPQHQSQSPQRPLMSPQIDLQSPQPHLQSPQRSPFMSKDTKIDTSFMVTSVDVPHTDMDVSKGQQPQRRVSTGLSAQPLLEQSIRPTQVSPRRKSQEFPSELLILSSRRNTISVPEEAASVTHLDRRFPPLLGSDMIFSKERTHNNSSLPPPVSISLDHAPHDSNSQSPMQSLTIPPHQESILLSPKKVSPGLQFKERTPDQTIFPPAPNKTTLQEPLPHFPKGPIHDQMFVQYPKGPTQDQLFCSTKGPTSEFFKANKNSGESQILLHPKSTPPEKQTPSKVPEPVLVQQKNPAQELGLQHSKGPQHVLEHIPQHDKGLLMREPMFSPKVQPDNPFTYPDQNIDFLLNSPPRNNLGFPSFPACPEVNMPAVTKQPDYSQDPLFIAVSEVSARPTEKESSHPRRNEAFPASFYQEPVPGPKSHQDTVTVSLQQNFEDDKKGTRKRKRSNKKTTNEDRAAALAEQQAIEQSVQANVDSIRKALNANQAKAAAEKANMVGTDKKKTLDAYDFEAHIGQDTGGNVGVLSADTTYPSYGETDAKPLRSRNERGRGRGYGTRRGRRGRGSISSVNEAPDALQRTDTPNHPPSHFTSRVPSQDHLQPHIQQHFRQQFPPSPQQQPAFQRQTSQPNQVSRPLPHFYQHSHPSPMSCENSSSLSAHDWQQKQVPHPYQHNQIQHQPLLQPQSKLPVSKSDVLSPESNRQDLDLSYGESELIINLDDQPSSTEGKENQYNLSSDGEERGLIPSPSTPKSQRSTRARKQPDYKAIASGNVHTPVQPRSARSVGSPRGLGNGAQSPKSVSPRTRSTENMSSTPVVKLEKLEVGRTTRSRREIGTGKAYGKDNVNEIITPNTSFEDQKNKSAIDESRSVSKENIYEFVDNEHDQQIETSLRSVRARKKRASENQEFQVQQPMPDYMPASPTTSSSNSSLFVQEPKHAFETHTPEIKPTEDSVKPAPLSNVDAIIEAVSKGNFGGSFEEDQNLEPPAPAVIEPEPVPAPPPTRSSRRSTEIKKEAELKEKAEKTFVIAEPPRFEGKEGGRKGPTVPPLRIKVAHGTKVEKSEEKHYVIERSKGACSEHENPPLAFTVKLSDSGTATIKPAGVTGNSTTTTPPVAASGGKTLTFTTGEAYKNDNVQKKDGSLGLFSGLPQNEQPNNEQDLKFNIPNPEAPSWKTLEASTDDTSVARTVGAMHPKVAAKVQASQESQNNTTQVQTSVSQSLQQYPPSSTSSIPSLSKSSPVTPATPLGIKHSWSSGLKQDAPQHQTTSAEQTPSSAYLPTYIQTISQMPSSLSREPQMHQQSPASVHQETKQPPNAHSQPILHSDRPGKPSKPVVIDITTDRAPKLTTEPQKHHQGSFGFPPHVPPAHSGQRAFIMPSDQPGGHHGPHFPNSALLKSAPDSRPSKSPSIQSQPASKIGPEVRTQTPPVTPGAMLYAGVVSGQPHSLSPTSASPEGQVIERIQNPIRQPEASQAQPSISLHLPGSHLQDPTSRFMKDDVGQEGPAPMTGHSERAPSREIAMFQHMIEQQRLQQHLLMAEVARTAAAQEAAARNSAPDAARNIAANIVMRNALESSRNTPVTLEGGRKGPLPQSQPVGHSQPLNLTPQSDNRSGQTDSSRVTPKSTPPAPQSPFSMPYFDRKGDTGRLSATGPGSFMQPSPGGHREGLASHLYPELSLANLTAPHPYMVGRLPIDPRIYGSGQQPPPHLMRDGVLPGSFSQAFPPGTRFPGLEHPDGKKGDSGHPEQPAPHMLRSPSPIQRQLQADALRQQLTRMPCDLPTRDSPVGFLQRYPVMWQGALALKNDNSYVQMHFIAGNRRLPNQALPQPMQNGALPPLRISQRMRLEHAQLEGVAKRMQCEDHYCILIAVACGRDQMDINQQTRALNEGFITYLLSKQAAGIVNVPLPGSEQVRFVVHIFPPCEFVDNSVAQQGSVILMEQLREVPHAVVIIATT